MACGTGFCVGKMIAAVVAVGVGGYAAFNYTTTGCVLGSCDTEAPSTSIQEVAATDAVSACCQAKPECDGSDCGTGCSDCAPAAEMVEAAAVQATEGASCSEGKTCPLTGEVMEVAATTDDAACEKACEDKTGCEGEAEEVAVDTETENKDG